MDPQRERIQADLRGLLAGEVFCDDPFTLMYARDASVYQVRPLGVVRPRGLADVQACRAVCRRAVACRFTPAGPARAWPANRSARGWCSISAGRCGGSSASSGDTVTVQPGVVLGQLNRYLAAFGRQFGPDPATGGVTTMGSVLALDNSGSNWLRHGSARQARREHAGRAGRRRDVGGRPPSGHRRSAPSIPIRGAAIWSGGWPS